MSTRHRVSLILSGILVLVGITIIIRTALGGGGGLAVGFVFGIALTLAGLGRGWLAWQSRNWR